MANKDGKALERVLVVGPGRNDNAELGALLRKVREQARLSVSEAAGKAELTAAYIRMIEKGVKVPALGTVTKLLEAYGQADVVEVESEAENGLRPDLVLSLPGANTQIAIEFKSRIREARATSIDQLIRKMFADDPPAQRLVATDRDRRDEQVGRIVRLLPRARPEMLNAIEALLINIGDMVEIETRRAHDGISPEESMRLVYPGHTDGTSGHPSEHSTAGT